MDPGGAIETSERFVSDSNETFVLPVLALCWFQRMAHGAVRNLRLQVCCISDPRELRLRCNHKFPLLLHCVLSRPEPRAVSIGVPEL